MAANPQCWMWSWPLEFWTWRCRSSATNRDQKRRKW